MKHGESNIEINSPEWAMSLLTLEDFATLEEYEEKRRLNETLTVYDRTIDIMKKYLG